MKEKDTWFLEAFSQKNLSQFKISTNCVIYEKVSSKINIIQIGNFLVRNAKLSELGKKKKRWFLLKY